jgi:23S rRNA (uracil1939-C5)-methyltransferase
MVQTLQRRRRRSSDSERIRVPDPLLFPQGQLLDLRVTRLAQGGRGVGRRDGFVFLVDGALPGDLARIRITRRKPSYAEAETMDILQPSSERVCAPCEHASLCGGCRWMSLSADAQLSAKRALVVEALQRVGRLNGVPVAETTASPLPLGYRNRIDLAFGLEEGRLVVGFHPRGEPGRVFSLGRCHLAPPLFSEVARESCRLLAQQGCEPFETGGSQGLLRQLVLRGNHDGSELLVNLVTTSAPWTEGTVFARQLRERFPAIVGVVRSVTDRRSLAVRGESRTLNGRGFLLERLCGLELEVSAGSFLQVNAEGAERLYDIVLNRLNARPAERVLDLYCGVGSISLLAARGAGRVIGVESDLESVRRARRNAARNGLANLRFERSEVATFLERFVASGDRVEAVLVNPPRAGLDGKALSHLVGLASPRLIYVSCHPPSLGRDMKLLADGGYRLASAQPVDLFPQTHHVEVVAELLAAEEP